jgi:hypothetical protein
VKNYEAFVSMLKWVLSSDEVPIFEGLPYWSWKAFHIDLRGPSILNVEGPSVLILKAVHIDLRGPSILNVEGLPYRFLKSFRIEDCPELRVRFKLFSACAIILNKCTRSF